MLLSIDLDLEDVKETDFQPLGIPTSIFCSELCLSKLCFFEPF